MAERNFDFDLEGEIPPRRRSQGDESGPARKKSKKSIVSLAVFAILISVAAVSYQLLKEEKVPRGGANATTRVEQSKKVSPEFKSEFEELKKQVKSLEGMIEVLNSRVEELRAKSTSPAPSTPAKK